jgi:hypothetical protein
VLAGTAEKLLAVSFISLMVVLSATFAAAQQPNNPPFDFPAHGKEPPERTWEEENRRLRLREPRIIEKGPLAVPDRDRIAYASFLAKPKTGMIRLLPRINPRSVFAFSGKRPPINGGGAYYSFYTRSHDYDAGADLEFSMTQVIEGTVNRVTELPPQKYFSVGFAGANLGMLANIGDVSLADLTVEDPRLAFIAAYETPSAESRARSEKKRFGQGLTIDGQTYKQRLTVQLKATYVLRSINYDESDILVGFQVVREESDGSLIIAWKLMKSYARPQLARNR